MTKHEQVVSSIKSKIESGVLQPGFRMPPEKILCDEYSISRTTLRKVEETLLLDGYVERKTDKGLYIANLVFNANFSRPYSVFHEMQKEGKHPSSKIIKYSITPASDSIASIMHCAIDEPLIEIHRIRLVDEKPFCINHLYLIESKFPNFNPWSLVDSSFHDILRQQYKYNIQKSEQRVSSCLATKQLASLLEVDLKAPLLYTSSVLYLDSNEIVELQNSWINTDLYPYNYRYVWNNNTK